MKKGELTGYWQRLQAEALQLLAGRIEAMEKKTVDPEYCLLPDDAQMMAMRQLEIEGLRDIERRVREGSKLWALDTVAQHNPLHLFNPRPTPG